MLGDAIGDNHREFTERTVAHGELVVLKGASAKWSP